MNVEQNLSRRERQIMDVLHAKGQATAAEVLAELPNPPGYSAVRALLRILEEKGHTKHHREGAFFQGSVAQAMAALLETADTELSDAELIQLQQLVEKARKEGR